MTRQAALVMLMAALLAPTPPRARGAEDCTIEGPEGLVFCDADITISNLTLTSGANLIICNGTVTITQSLTVAPNAVIDIQDGGTLNLSLQGWDAEIGGTIILSSGSSVLLINTSMTLSPWQSQPGSIRGEHPDAAIRIVEPATGVRTLTNQLTIEGTLAIEPVIVPGSGVAKLFNQKIMTSDASAVLRADGGPLVLDAELRLADSALNAQSRPIYHANGGTLEFRWRNDGFNPSAFEHPVLSGDFAACHCGTLRFKANVVTTGTLLALVGRLEFDNDACFAWSDGGTCENMSDLCD